MNTCQEIQEHLYAAESDSAVASHLANCNECQAVAAKVLAVDAAVRAVPTPAGAARSQAAFLQMLQPIQLAVPRRRRVAALAWATAAAVFVAVGVASFLFAPASQVQAKSQVVGTLVDWNLQLSETQEREERERLHRDRLPELQKAVHDAKLSPRERELAQQLLEQGAWLAQNDDTLDTAERFQDIADTVLTMMEESPAPQSEQYAVYYSKLADRGVEAKLALAENAPATDGHQAKMLRMAKRQQRHAAKLEAIAAKLSESAREKVLPKKKNGKPKAP